MQEYGKKCFDTDWKFILADNKDFSEKSFDDSEWRSLNLPHDWSIEGAFDKDNPTTKRGGFLPGGIGWYRKTFSSNCTSRTFLQFDGVYNTSEIWVNGTKAYSNSYGYLSFRFEITEFLKKGENTVAVRADDSALPSSRWYNGCGIFRHVWIIEKNQSLINSDTFVYSKSIENCNAQISVNYTVNGDDISYCSLKLCDKDNNVVSLNKSAKTNGENLLDIDCPVLWTLKNPYLYTLYISAYNENSELIDCQTIRVGIRKAIFTADKGFLLNGIQTKIKGICMHHEAGGLGSAVPDSILKERIKDLKAGGINAIRTGHTPFAPEFYDFCDEIGVMVMDECFDGWQKKAPFDYGARFFQKRCKIDLETFIKRDRNHPCIIIWGIGNETGHSDINGLSEVCHKFDHTRPVSGGQLIGGVDVIGLNGPSENPAYIENMRYENPDRPILLTEYPHCYSTRGFYRTQTWWRDYGRARFDIADYSETEVFDDWQPKFSNVVCYNSSYDNACCRISNKKAWQRVRDFEHISGMFMWTGFDYLGESFGWPYRSGNNGLMDLAGFKKDIYYLYQSQWTDEPMVHLLPHWNHPTKNGKLIPVVAYTNCESVELFLNNKSLGKQYLNGQQELVWHVTYQAGELKAIAQAKDGTVVTDKKVTPESPVTIKLSATQKLNNELNNTIGIVAEAVDKNGNFVNDCDNRVFFSVSGGAELKALENGDPFDLQNCLENNRRLFYGLQKAYVTYKDDSPAILTVCSVMGKNYFEENTYCSLSVKQYDLKNQKTIDKQAVIKYTLNNGNPLQGKNFTEPVLITDSCTVKAVAIIDNQEIYFDGEFLKGSKQEEVKEFVLPLSQVVVGTWAYENKKFKLLPDGNVELFENDKKVREASWWYEVPIDEFESDTGDIDNGEIQFNFDCAKLKLMKDGTLRHKMIKQEGTVTTFYKRV